MTMIRYGTQRALSQQGDIVTLREKVFVDFATKHEAVIYTETVYVSNNKEILAEFLNLLDRQSSGEVDLIGLQTMRDARTGQMRVEKTWAEPSLH